MKAGKLLHKLIIGTCVIIGIFISAGCSTDHKTKLSSIAGHWESFEMTGENPLGMRNTITPGDSDWQDGSLNISADGKVSIPARGFINEIHGSIRAQPAESGRFFVVFKDPLAEKGPTITATATYDEKSGTLTIVSDSGKSVVRFSKEKRHDNKNPPAKSQPVTYYQKKDNTYWSMGKIGGAASSSDCEAFLIPPSYVDFPMLSDNERKMILKEVARNLMAEIDKADKEGRIFSQTEEQVREFSKRCWPKTDPESIAQWRKQHPTESGAEEKLHSDHKW